MAKRRVVVRRKTYVPPVLPERPKVTVGPRSYGRSKKGAYIVIRFYVVEHNGKWFVIDIEGKRYIADGTKKKGYSKADAITVARNYRDEFGAWSLVPF